MNFPNCSLYDINLLSDSTKYVSLKKLFHSGYVFLNTLCHIHEKLKRIIVMWPPPYHPYPSLYGSVPPYWGGERGGGEEA